MDERHSNNPNQELIYALEQELNNFNADAFPTIYSVIENELYRLRGSVTEWIDLLSHRRCKLRTKVCIPVDPSSRENYVGKLIGPGGKNLKALQESTGTKMAILGHGSMRNDDKEAEFLATGDPKYQHLKNQLHLQIDSVGPPTEAYYQISHALAEVKKYMLVNKSNNGNFGNERPSNNNVRGGFRSGGGGGGGGGYDSSDGYHQNQYADGDHHYQHQHQHQHHHGSGPPQIDEYTGGSSDGWRSSQRGKTPRGRGGNNNGRARGGRPY